MRTTRAMISIVLALLAACIDEPRDRDVTGSEDHRAASTRAAGAGGTAIPAMPDLVSDVTEVRSDAAIRMEADLTDAELVTAVGDAGGRAFVAFKPTTAQHSRGTGIFPAMSRDFALSVRSEVIARGARLIRTFPTSATIVVEMAPDLAPALRQLPFVNYVEPVRRLGIAAQDTAWGVTKIGAPTIWTAYHNHGEYSTISFLDTGIDQTHFGIELLPNRLLQGLRP